MNNKCKTCPVRDFVHADLYCHDCQDRPRPKTITGTAYLLKEYGSGAIVSAKVEAPAGLEYEQSAVELMRKCKIEFHEDEYKPLFDLLQEELNNVPYKLRGPIET